MGYSNLETHNTMDESPIQKFYKSSNVFLTGGTGFMGKVFIEKLLRTTDISTLYMLVRKKKGQEIHQVLDKLFEDRIFKKLEEVCPKFREKIQAISGDCCAPNLGIDYMDRRRVVENTNIIFHLAATVRFDADLKEAYAINVNATRDIVHMAKQMNNLKAFIYVSTAYSNHPRNNIDEKIYDFPYSCEGISSVLAELDDSDIQKLTPKLLGPWPNTYTFTKALTESFIQNTATDLPVAIFRPSIVMPTYTEPLEGWTDSFNGPIGICTGVVGGILNVMPYHVEDNISDIVPVDSCIAGMIAAAWDVNTKFARNQENIEVYNFVCSKENPISWKNMMNTTVVEARKLNAGSHGRIMVIFPPNAITFWISYVFLHLISSYLNDLYAVMRRKKFRLSRVYKKYLKAYNVMYPFYSRTWTFENKNVKELWIKMDQRDQELFPALLGAIDWNAYFKTYVKGLHEKLMMNTKQDLVHFEKQDRYHVLRQFFKSTLVFILCNFLMNMKIS